MTMVEMITVIGVIGIMASIGYVSFSGVREESRDNRRMTDIDQLQLTMRLYAEQYGVNGNFNCGNGLKIDGTSAVSSNNGSGSCADGAQILAFIDRHMGGIPHDPRGPGDPDYYYYFDGAHICDTSGGQPLVFAVNMETDASNAAEVCGDVDGNDGGYLRTDGHMGGSINPSTPYVRLVLNKN